MDLNVRFFSYELSSLLGHAVVAEPWLQSSVDKYFV